MSDAALTLCQSGIDVVCQISDNLTNSLFPAIARACEMAKTPLFTFSPTLGEGRGGAGRWAPTSRRTAATPAGSSPR